MDLKNIKLTLSQVLGTSTPILVSQTKKTLFVDGKPTDKHYISATVTAPECNFECVDVKLADKGVDISNEEILARNCTLDFVRVQFVGDEVSIYNDFKTNTQKISAKAEMMKIVEETEIDI